jgi:hypothetical protein
MSEASVEGRISAARALIHTHSFDCQHEQLEAAVFLLENGRDVHDCTTAACILVNCNAPDYKQERMKAAAYLFQHDEDE